MRKIKIFVLALLIHSILFYPSYAANSATVAVYSSGAIYACDSANYEGAT